VYLSLFELLISSEPLDNLIYSVIRNDCRGFNNLSYTLHLR